MVKIKPMQSRDLIEGVVGNIRANINFAGDVSVDLNLIEPEFSSHLTSYKLVSYITYLKCHTDMIILLNRTAGLEKKIICGQMLIPRKKVLLARKLGGQTKVFLFTWMRIFQSILLT